MSAKKFTVNGCEFKTQQDLVTHIRNIIARYANGQATLDMFDFPFMADLLQLHPEAEQKIGCGIASIYVADNPQYPGPRSRGFWLCRIDGSTTDFSFWECIKPTAHDKKVRRAMRAAVEPYTMEFKQRVFDLAPLGSVRCPDTGEVLTFTTSHVDHKAPNTFDALVDQFLRRESLRFDDIEVATTADNKYQDRMIDLRITERWIEFHNTYATLELVSKTANLSLRSTTR